MSEKMKWHPFDSELPAAAKRGKRRHPGAQPVGHRATGNRLRPREQRPDARDPTRRKERAAKKR